MLFVLRARSPDHRDSGCIFISPLIERARPVHKVHLGLGQRDRVNVLEPVLIALLIVIVILLGLAAARVVALHELEHL